MSKCTRKNKQGVCVPKIAKPLPKETKTKRCPNGTRKNKQGECVPKDTVLKAKPVTPKAKRFKGKGPTPFISEYTERPERSGMGGRSRRSTRYRR